MFDLFGNTDAAANKIIKDKTMKIFFPIIIDTLMWKNADFSLLC